MKERNDMDTKKSKSALVIAVNVIIKRRNVNKSSPQPSIFIKHKYIKY